ncbi:MAG: MBL fold metallo-hydrolase, partial [Clostridia bacterium]|nr:MBL fold metallo-hydrolase [Clostridia bacterium]
MPPAKHAPAAEGRLPRGGRRGEVAWLVVIRTLLEGFPGRSERGFLGWSSCHLVLTPGGRRLLFDTGGMNERVELPARLAAAGVAPEEVEAVVLSHLHFDHAANWELFPRAEILVHRRELEYAASDGADPATLRCQARELARHPRLRPVEGELELGEGLRLLEVPGHTPGSLALEAGEAVLCGDALKNRWDLEGGVPQPVWDPGLARASIQRLAARAGRLYPGHDAPLERRGGGWVPAGWPRMRLLLPAGGMREVALE